MVVGGSAHLLDRDDERAADDCADAGEPAQEGVVGGVCRAHGQEDPGQRRSFLIPQASTISRALLEENGLAAYQDRLDFRIITEDRYSMMAACDACLAASGTVTLELALLRVPSVVAYRVASHTYWLGRLIIRSLPFFSLPNLIAGQEIVPELLQNEVQPQQLLAKLKPLLKDGAARTAMQEDFTKLRLQLGETGAAKRTAALALQVMDSHD